MFAYVTALSVHGNIQAPCVTTHVTEHEECSRSVTRAFRLCTCVPLVYVQVGADGVM